MVSFNVYRSTTSGFYVEGVCLVTDEKPVVGIANGSILYAVDTTSGETTRYMYDQNSMSWIEAACPCGGGSGSGGGSVVHCPLTAELGSRTKLKAGMTFDELAMADQIIFDETDMGRVIGTFVCVAKGSNSLAIAYLNGKRKYEIITLTPDDEGYPSATVGGGVS